MTPEYLSSAGKISAAKFSTAGEVGSSEGSGECEKSLQVAAQPPLPSQGSSFQESSLGAQMLPKVWLDTSPIPGLTRSCDAWPHPELRSTAPAFCQPVTSFPSSVPPAWPSSSPILDKTWDTAFSACTNSAPDHACTAGSRNGPQTHRPGWGPEAAAGRIVAPHWPPARNPAPPTAAGGTGCKRCHLRQTQHPGEWATP